MSTKAKSFAALKAEIATLEAQAAEARRSEVKDAVASIRETMSKYSLTAADLGFKGQGPMAARVGTRRAGTGIPRYRDPKSGKTWTGFGKPPGWIATARSREAFLIDAVTPTAAPAASTGQAAKKQGAKSAQAAKSPKAASKPAAPAKPAGKAADKPGRKPAKAASTAASAKSTSPAPAKGDAAGRPKIAVRKIAVKKLPRPVTRKTAVGRKNGAQNEGREPTPSAESSVTPS